MTLDSFQMIIQQNNVELISSYNSDVTTVIHIAIFIMMYPYQSISFLTSMCFDVS
jgi:hypothetical protein